MNERSSGGTLDVEAVRVIQKIPRHSVEGRVVEVDVGPKPWCAILRVDERLPRMVIIVHERGVIDLKTGCLVRQET